MLVVTPSAPACQRCSNLFWTDGSWRDIASQWPTTIQSRTSNHCHDHWYPPRAGQEVMWPKVMALIGGWAKTGVPLLPLRGYVTLWLKVGPADQPRPRSGVPTTQNCRPYLGLDYKVLRPLGLWAMDEQWSVTPVKSQRHKSDLDSKLFQKSERHGRSLRQLPSPWPHWPRCNPLLVFSGPHPTWELSSLPRPCPVGSRTCCSQHSE